MHSKGWTWFCYNLSRISLLNSIEFKNIKLVSLLIIIHLAHKMKKIKSTFILLLFASNLVSQTMSLVEIENDLHKTYQKILHFRFDADTIGYDSMAIVNVSFANKIAEYTKKYPSTLTYRFDSLLKDNIQIVSSEDKLMRIYSWDTWMGGTMHAFENITQYKFGDKVYANSTTDSKNQSDEEGYNPYFYSKIYTLQANSKIYYLEISNGIFSTKDASQSIDVVSIKNDNLIDTVNIIKTPKGMVNSIDVEFDFFSVVDSENFLVLLIFRWLSLY